MRDVLYLQFVGYSPVRTGNAHWHLSETVHYRYELRAFTLDSGNTIRTLCASSHIAVAVPAMLLLQQRLNTARGWQRDVNCLPRSQCLGTCINSLFMTSSIAHTILFDAHCICQCVQTLSSNWCVFFFERYNRRRGINLGEVKLLVYVQELQGRQYLLNRSGPKGSVSLVKQWSPFITSYPLQTIVKDIYTHAPEYRECVKTLDELYQVGDLCFLFVPTFYGEQAEVRNRHFALCICTCTTDNISWYAKSESACQAKGSART